MRKCGNAEMRKCGNAEMRKCGNAEMRKSEKAEKRKSGNAKCGNAHLFFRISHFRIFAFLLTFLSSRRGRCSRDGVALQAHLFP